MISYFQFWFVVCVRLSVPSLIWRNYLFLNIT